MFKVGDYVRNIVPRSDYSRIPLGSVGIVHDYFDFPSTVSMVMVGRVWVIWEHGDRCFISPEEIEPVDLGDRDLRAEMIARFAEQDAELAARADAWRRDHPESTE